MLRMDLQDAQWLDAVSPVLDIYFEKDHRSHKRLNEPVRYTKPMIRFDVDNGLSDRYHTGVAFYAPDGRLFYVAWSDEEKRSLYESSRYIVNPPAVLIAAQQSGKLTIFFDTELDPNKDLTFGDKVSPSVWQPLRDAAEGRQSPDKSPRFTPV